MAEPARTLNEIRSDACNKILFLVSVLAVPGLAVVVARFMQQGFTPIMATYFVLAAGLAGVTICRRRVSLTVRAATVTAIPYVIGVTSILASAHLAAALMFFVSSCVLAGCFFGRRVAFGLVGFTVLFLMALFAAFRTGVLMLETRPDAFALSVVTWCSIITAFVFAGAAPVNALSAVYQALERERLRANAAVEARTAFLATMSHELRTPMAGIIGLAEVLRDADLHDQRKDAAGNLIRASRSLMAVLNDLLDFARLESGHIPVERAPFRLSEMTGDLCAMFEAKARQKGLEFRVEFPAAFTDTLMGDGRRIQQILSNLIDNAIKFTAVGGATLTINTVEDAGGLHLICTVADTGIGIPAVQQAQIFEPFVQGESSISRRFGGSGLGLAIARALAAAMGGTLGVASRVGEGSVFTLTAPVEPALVQAGPVQPAAPVEQASRPFPRTVKVLVAEDDANMRLILDIKLRHLGYVLTIVGDGAAALKEAANGYDCILMDMHMPVMNGPDAVRAIRAAEAAAGRARIPIIAMTADLIPERVRGFRDAGADDIAGKPVDWDALTAQIRRLVEIAGD